jgi:MFS family permease
LNPPPPAGGDGRPATDREAGPSPNELKRERLRSALRYSFTDGVLSCVMAAQMEVFAVPALIALGAGSVWVGVLAGLAALASAAAQVRSPRIIAEAPSRRDHVVRFVRLQVLACLAFATVFCWPRGCGWPLDRRLAIAVAVAAFAGYSVSQSISSAAWASWMADIVPRSSRGKYFSWRGRWMTLIYGALTLGTGFLLHFVWGDDKTVIPLTVFGVMFLVAGVSRLGASYCQARQFEPPQRERVPAEDFTYWQFLRKLGESNFANFTVALAVFSGAANLTGPFLQVYLLDDLHYGYGDYAMLPVASLVATVLMLPFWGRVADRWGNMLVVRICVLVISFIPLVYLGTPRYWLFIFGWVVGGAAWSGLNLAAFNYVMDTATPRRRVRCFAYMYATRGIGVALFMFGGGPAAELLPPLFGYRMQSLFLLSVALRLAAAVVLVSFVREVAARPQAQAMELVYELPAVRPTMEFLRYLARPFTRN